MNADGTGQTRLTVSPGASSFSMSPSWTPDGRIAFVSNVDGHIDAYIMNADGTGQQRLAEDAPAIGEMSWSPDDGR